jgi:ribonuclease P protein component
VTGFGFPPEFRLRSKADFDQVFALKQRASDGVLLVYGARNTLGSTRLGVIVSKKQGNSVRRHHLKRLLREAFRLTRPVLPTGLDLVVLPQAGMPEDVSAIQESFRRLSAKLDKRIDRS